MTEALLVYGAGGFAREVAWLVDSSIDSAFHVVGFVDDSPSAPQGWADERPIMSLSQARNKYPSAKFAVGVGSPSAKKLLADRLSGVGARMPAVCHSNVLLSPRVSVSDGVIVCSGCNLTVDIVIGPHVHINLNCTVGHDVIIGDYATLSPGVHVSGNVTIGEAAFIGTGACILNGTSDNPLVIGEGCVIAAGACITKSTDPYTLYAGVPAIAKKKLG